MSDPTIPLFTFLGVFFVIFLISYAAKYGKSCGLSAKGLTCILVIIFLGASIIFYLWTLPLLFFSCDKNIDLCWIHIVEKKANKDKAVYSKEKTLWTFPANKLKRATFVERIHHKTSRKRGSSKTYSYDTCIYIEGMGYILLNSAIDSRIAWPYSNSPISLEETERIINVFASSENIRNFSIEIPSMFVISRNTKKTDVDNLETCKIK